EYQLLLAKDLGYLNFDLYKKLNLLTQEVKRMLASYISKI
ncbi:MAG: four helix bundle protein, partial [Chloroflexota bacterium]